MLSSVLRSRRAVHANVEIMRAFVALRRAAISHDELWAEVARLERRYDARFKTVFDAIRQLMTPALSARRRIGFTPPGQPLAGLSGSSKRGRVQPRRLRSTKARMRSRAAAPVLSAAP